MPKGPLSKEEFGSIYSKVPRLTIEIVIISKKGVLLSLRDIEPCKGMWHLPGGTVRFGERLTDAVKRVALAELNLKVKVDKLLGYIEYPSHFENGLDSPVGIAFLSNIKDEIIPSSKIKWFKTLPENIHDEQKVFLEPLLQEKKQS